MIKHCVSVKCTAEDKQLIMMLGAAEGKKMASGNAGKDPEI